MKRRSPGRRPLLRSRPPLDAHHNITYSLAGTAGTNGWFRSNVTVQWSVRAIPRHHLLDGCEPGTTRGPKDSALARAPSPAVGPAGEHTVSLSVNVRIDKTAPSASGGASRGPDSNGWYNHPVSFGFSGTDAVSGVAWLLEPDLRRRRRRLGLRLRHVHGRRRQHERPGQRGLPVRRDATRRDGPPDAQPTGAWYRKAGDHELRRERRHLRNRSLHRAGALQGPRRRRRGGEGDVHRRRRQLGRDDVRVPLRRDRAEAAEAEGRRREGSRPRQLGRAADVASTQLIRTPGLKNAKPAVIYTGKAGGLRRQDCPAWGELPLPGRGRRRGRQPLRQGSSPLASRRRSIGPLPGHGCGARSAGLAGGPARPSTTSSSTGTGSRS